MDHDFLLCMEALRTCPEQAEGITYLLLSSTYFGVDLRRVWLSQLNAPREISSETTTRLQLVIQTSP